MVKAATLSISLAVVCLLVAFGVSSAQADQIVFGPSTQSVTFTNVNSTTLSLTLGSAGSPCSGTDLCLSGPGHVGAVTGTFMFDTAATPLPTVSLGPPNPFGGAYFISGGTSTFTYTGSNSSSLVGTITWNYVKDDSPNPNLSGLMKITSVSGTDLTNSFTAGGYAGVDFTLNSISPTVTGLFSAAAGSTTGDTISSGEVSTPEPASLLLLGTGLLACAFLIRRKMLTA